MTYLRYVATAALALLLLYVHYTNQHRRWINRQWVVRPMNRDRTLLGEYYTKFWSMRDDPAKFHTRFRMRVGTYLFIGDDISTIALAELIGESTVRELIKEVCQAIIEILKPIYLRKPTEEEWLYIIADFLLKWNIPNCAGAIDGKHIMIECPDNSGTEYFNYLRYFSTVLMAVCDADHIFTLVHIGEQGSNGDAGIFNNCPIGQILYREELGLPKGTASLPGSDVRTPCYFVGDDAFGHSEKLMKPYPGQNFTEAQRIFNLRLSKARRVIESAFGIMSNRFSVFRTYIPFQPEVVDDIVLASVILHNFLKIHENSLPPHERVYCSPSFVDKNVGNGQIQDGDWRADPARFVRIRAAQNALDATDRAKTMRDRLYQYFLTPADELPWQYNRVRFAGQLNF